MFMVFRPGYFKLRKFDDLSQVVELGGLTYFFDI